MNRKICIYDTECSGLDTSNDFIQELAWAVYDVDSMRCLTAKSYIIDWPTYYAVHPEAEAVTGLSRQFCSSLGKSPHHVFAEFLLDSDRCDYLCGHNAITYDMPMMKTNIKRSMLFDWKPEQLHIDTLTDCPFPSHMKVHALKYLAFEHGYILSDAHQALADVFACKAILAKYEFNLVVEIAKTPLVTITSKIDFNDLDAREKIKQAKFYWNPGKKLWEKKIREFYLPGIQLVLEGIKLTTEL